jgi:hypothetical protein
MTNENRLELHKKQLFDFQFVCEIVASAIILFLTEERNEDSESLDEDQVADFVLKNFPVIIDSITDDSDKIS